MTSLTPSPVVVALVQAATSLPVFLVGLPAGALADIVDRRRLLIVSQGWMLLAAAALGVLTLIEFMSPWILLALEHLVHRSIARSCWNPARRNPQGAPETASRQRQDHAGRGLRFWTVRPSRMGKGSHTARAPFAGRPECMSHSCSTPLTRRPHRTSTTDAMITIATLRNPAPTRPSCQGAPR